MNDISLNDSDSQLSCDDNIDYGSASAWNTIESIGGNSDNSTATTKRNKKTKKIFFESSSSSSSSSSSKKKKRRKSWPKKLIPKKYQSTAHTKKRRKHSTTTSNTTLLHFFETIQSLQNDIDTILSNTNQINQINDEIVSTVEAEKEREKATKLNEIVNDTNRIARNVKHGITLLGNENSRLKKLQTSKEHGGSNEGEGEILRPSDLRIRENLCNAVTHKFADATNKCRKAEEKHKMDMEQRVSRQIRIVMPDANENDIKAIIQSGQGQGGKDYFLQQMILGNVASDLILSMHQSVSQKYKDILLLEQSINELHQMYIDVAILTEQQGEVLDQIEYQVQIVNDNIEESNINLHHAIKDQKKIRKKQCIIIGIIVVVVIVIVVGVLLA